MSDIKFKFITTNKDALHVTSTDVIKEESVGLANRLMSALKLCKGRALGLSAIQLGIPKRACVVVFEGKPMVLFNPITVASEGEVENREGCLSIPNKHYNVKRNNKVTIQCYNKNWEYIELKLLDKAAYAIQHEIDHMNGVLICDKGELTD